MGYCCSGVDPNKDPGNVVTSLYPNGATLDGRVYTMEQIYIIVKI